MDIDVLHAQVRKLEQRVAALEARLAEMDESPAPPVPEPQAEPQPSA